MNLKFRNHVILTFTKSQDKLAHNLCDLSDKS